MHQKYFKQAIRLITKSLLLSGWWLLTCSSDLLKKNFFSYEILQRNNVILNDFFFFRASYLAYSYICRRSIWNPVEIGIIYEYYLLGSGAIFRHYLHSSLSPLVQDWFFSLLSFSSLGCWSVVLCGEKNKGYVSLRLTLSIIISQIEIFKKYSKLFSKLFI